MNYELTLKWLLFELSKGHNHFKRVERMINNFSILSKLSWLESANLIRTNLANYFKEE